MAEAQSYVLNIHICSHHGHGITRSRPRADSTFLFALSNPQLLMLFIVIFKENLGHLITMKFVPNETV